ncbi:transketolase [Klebsiella pneumoniae]|uniref:Transketolase n=1 Tax=Klebsiella pneumoniae TaxID=573 RepID=A0A2X3GPM7_KLEPN|nr:transketolase [Klebsiella pneumoniae]
MTADLSKYTDLHIFAQAFPDRFFQMGMAEQLLMAAAGGMAKEGFIPFAPPMPPLQPVAPMILFTRSSPKSI